METTEYVEGALQYWSSSYPRRVTKYQQWSTTAEEAASLLLDAEDDPQSWPFISVYSFPRGHTKDGNIPRVDRLFIDFDVPDTGEYRSKRDEEGAWIRDMSKLLVRTRKVAQFLLKTKHPESWQVALSGRKGIHLDLVFPPVDPRLGSLTKYVNGMVAYAEDLKDHLIEHTGLDDLDEYIDVDSSDLGRMRRVPNTLHLGATQSFGEDRFCVPITLEELATLKPADYIKLTRQRREPDDRFRAVPNQKAGEVLAQRIKMAPGGGGRGGGGGRTYDPAAIEAYEAAQNGRITIANLDRVMTHRPCLAAFRERDDAFGRQSASHKFELFAITQMMDEEVPVEVEYDNPEGKTPGERQPHVVGGTMLDFFRGLPEFDESYTCERIETYISMGYKPASCETVWRDASTFCLGDSCHIWADSHAVQ